MDDTDTAAKLRRFIIDKYVLVFVLLSCTVHITVKCPFDICGETTNLNIDIRVASDAGNAVLLRWFLSAFTIKK
jgi:hypothetical protein